MVTEQTAHDGQPSTVGRCHASLVQVGLARCCQTLAKGAWMSRRVSVGWDCNRELSFRQHRFSRLVPKVLALGQLEHLEKDGTGLGQRFDLSPTGQRGRPACHSPCALCCRQSNEPAPRAPPSWSQRCPSCQDRLGSQGVAESARRLAGGLDLGIWPGKVPHRDASPSTQQLPCPGCLS